MSGSSFLLVARFFNGILLIILAAAMIGFAVMASAVGIFLALITAMIAVAVFKHNAWGYFAAAALGFGCFQLAKEGLEFQTVKRYVMMIGFFTIPLALFLHQVLAKTPANSSTNSDKDDHSGRNMPN